MPGALIASGIIFVLLLGWVGVQALVRKQDKLPPDCDVIGDTGRGCEHCGKRHACDIAKDGGEE